MKVTRGAVSIVATAALLVAGLTATGTSAAFAADGVVQTQSGQDQCLVTPASTKLIDHEAVYKDVTSVTPGEEETSHLEQRWSKDVPGVEAISHEEAQYSRVIAAVDELTHERWKYSQVISGQQELSHSEYRFVRDNPGSQEVSHLERQFKRDTPAQEEVSHKEYLFDRQNPGADEVSHQEYRFWKTIPGQREVSHQEFKYSKTVTEYRYQSRVKRPDNTVERKFIKGWDFVDGGETRVDGKKVAGHWVESAGWHAIPDVIINIVWGNGGPPANLLGGSEAKPKGSVPLSVYGGPNKSVPYYASLVTITGGYTDWGPWSGWTTTNPGASTNLMNAESRQTTTQYNGGSWTTDTPGAPWVKVDERKVIDQASSESQKVYRTADGSASVNKSDAAWSTQAAFAGWDTLDAKKVIDSAAVAPFREYRTADGSASVNEADAAWVSESSFEGWNQYNSKKVVDSEAVPASTHYRLADGSSSTRAADAAWFAEDNFAEWEQFGDAKKVIDSAAVAPFREYRTADGSASVNEADAAWVSESSFEGWNQLGAARTVIDQEAVAESMLYLVSTDGVLSTSTEASDASWFTSAEGIDAIWAMFGLEVVVDQEAVPEKVLYLTRIDGVFGETENVADASWIDYGEENGVDTSVWSAIVDQETKVPVLRTVVDQEATPGYVVYYVAGKDPSRKLGDANWTIEAPEGWTKVDERKVVDREAVAPVTTTKKELVKAAWTEKVATPAKYGKCSELAVTGGGVMLPVGIAAAVLIILGAGAVILTARRRRESGSDIA